ncbi:MAG: 4Fe-4S binding protein [Candidatus Omnitrophota bacterium]
MAKRKIIKIDQEKCNGCGLCMPNCPEGALQIIDGKAHLVSDLFCDGLGVCIGHCPQGAISVEEREAGEYDEIQVMENIVKQGDKVITAHLKHLIEHGQKEYFKQAVAFLKEKGFSELVDKDVHLAYLHSHAGSCPGSKTVDLRSTRTDKKEIPLSYSVNSRLGNWPVQISLVPVSAPYLQDADLLIAADCVPFAYANFHNEILKKKVLLVGCPKLDDISFYKEKISQIVKNNNINSLTYAHMEVPCCSGLIEVIKSAIADSGKNIEFKDITVSIEGKILK